MNIKHYLCSTFLIAGSIALDRGHIKNTQSMEPGVSFMSDLGAKAGEFARFGSVLTALRSVCSRPRLAVELPNRKESEEE